MNYRPEIDGLRAISVISVILFHAGFSIFSGGYVGVDIFFVISGYLITSILISELDGNRFKIISFYERRARRILPALFLVLIVCIPFAFAWMSPAQIKDFGASLFSVSLSISNLYFMSQVNYFGGDAEWAPLLHTWSLAVEEQYYFLFPIILIFLWRQKNINRGFLVFLMVVVSFVFSEWAWRQNSARSFYFTFSRLWEIGVGSLCAFYLSKHNCRPNNMLGLLGILFVMVSIFYFDSTVPFPSIFTLLPVLGGALIIVFARDLTFVTRLLSNRFLVKIGLLSYSAYLWHQPLFAFAHIRLIEYPSMYTMAFLSILTFVLAWFSWRYVEIPFRSDDHKISSSRIKLFLYSSAGILLFTILGLIIYIKDGFVDHFDPSLRQYYLAADDRANRDCLFSKGDSIVSHPISHCLHLSQQEIKPRVLLIGDSHSNAISDVVGSALFERGITYYNVAYSGCPPLPSFVRQDQGAQHECSLFSQSVYDYAKSVNIETIVITARFPWYLDGYRFNNYEGGIEVGEPAIVDIEGFVNSEIVDTIRRDRLVKAIQDQITYLASNFNVVLVYPIPEAGWNVPERAFKLARFGNAPLNLTTSFDRYIERSLDVITIFDRLAATLPRVHAARVYKVMCSEASRRCVNADVNGVYYFDDDHLSNAGARLIEGVIVDAVTSSLNMY